MEDIPTLGALEVVDQPLCPLTGRTLTEGAADCAASSQNADSGVNRTAVTEVQKMDRAESEALNRDQSRPPDLRAGPGPSDTKSRDSSSGSAGTMLVMEKCLHRGRKRSGVWEEEQLSSCALCQDVLKDPVSTSCGHWFCRQSSSSYWDQSALSGHPPCPQCGERTITVA
ncbi:unnamed protein product, partial [Menidia menidia]